MKIELLRSYYPKGVNGEIWHNDELICYAIELPWRDNMRNISCIPEGEYVLKKRVSQKFGDHLILCNVKGRDLILIHPANVATRELRGCIAPVMKLTGVGTGIYSRLALQKVLTLVYGALDIGDEVVLVVKERK